uniref:CAMK/RAD53 protein kinase n=1 Tax=Mycena chlorophos TaxID=658473 RepID=A0ABQ0M2I7_MYCCL|nr:CAMK/RAD53 protein kinase [Mycena chlorophos]
MDVDVFSDFSSQPAFAPPPRPRPGLLHWGFLEPINPSPRVQRIVLVAREVYVGREEFAEPPEVEVPGPREVEGGDEYTMAAVMLPCETISTHHATFFWNGKYGAAATVSLLDHSTNGTFVDGVRIGVDNFKQIYDGHEVCFGCLVPIREQPDDDYRYIFRFLFEFDGHPETLRGRRKTESLFVHYELGRFIASGAHGVIHKAANKQTGKFYAVKSTFRDPDREDASLTALASQEVVVLTNLRHHNICKLKDVFFRLDGEVVDSVLEYVDGARLDSIDNLQETHVREIAYQLCEGITYMHGRSVFHGDLKPDNVMLTRREPCTVKIVDFGMARVGTGFNIDLVTHHRWGAPEAGLQIRRMTFANTPLQNIGLWDSWALGLIIFFLLTSEPPFVKHTPPGADTPFEVGIDTIQWHLLTNNGTSDVAQDFVRSLIVVDPTARASVSGVFRTHDWFHRYKPGHLSFEGVRFRCDDPDAEREEEEREREWERERERQLQPAKRRKVVVREPPEAEKTPRREGLRPRKVKRGATRVPS